MSQTRGFSLIELLIVVAIILIITAIAVPNLLQARIRSQEASAVNSVRTITSAEIMYRIRFGTYTGLADLHEEGILDTELGTAPHQKSGYVFSATGDIQSFTVGATPIADGAGRRSFCSDTPAVIRFAESGSCDTGSSPTIE